MGQSLPQSNLSPSGQPSQPSPDQPSGHKIHIRSLLVVFFTLLIVIGLLAPSELVGLDEIMVFGILGLGITAAISVIISETRRAKNTYNPLVALFVFVAGLGIGIVIFIAAAIASMIAYIGANPDDIQCG
jgi:hypothetical protein